MLTKKDQTRWARESRDVVDRQYLSWLHDCPCLVCGRLNIEAHHVLLRSTNARDDHLVVPLCPEHHRGTFSPHGMDSGRFYEMFPKRRLVEIAKDYYMTYLRSYGGTIPYWHVYPDGLTEKKVERGIPRV